MRCERDWGRRDGVKVRCVKSGAHDFPAGCEVETPTQAAEAAVRAVLGDDQAQIAIRWANDKIVGILYNGVPLGKREWDACWAVSLPLVEWRGAPEDAWLISTGRAFRCSDCKQVVPSSQGADDDAPDACDACWAKRRSALSDRFAMASTLAEAVETLRDLSRVNGLDVVRRLVKAAAEAIAVKPGASVEDTARMAGEFLTLPAEIVADEVSMGANNPDQHAATLSAHCGCRPWGEMAGLSKRLWRERAKRLRARWGVEEQDRLRALLEEMSERLNKDTDEHLRLREALRSEPEWVNPCVGLVDAAAVAIGRLKRERDANAAVAIEAQGAAREALAQRDEFDKHRRYLSAQIGVLGAEVSGEREWIETLAGSPTANVVLRVIRRLRSEAAQPSLRQACRTAVEAWERHGLAGLACHMYDLRAALEKAK